MPTYDYKCTNCKFELEIFQTMSDEPLKACPNCNTENLERLFGSGAGLIFKGSGFYLTDYKKSTSPKESKPVPPKETKPTSTESKK
ncbi:MAG: zinc ribbon domain-containing protein [Bacteroidota bacterium]